MSWFSSVERAADITEVVDHRIDLGTAQGLHGWVVLQFSPGRVDLLLCSVDRFNLRCRIDARFDRRLQPSQPLFGLGDGPGCRLPACRGSLCRHRRPASGGPCPPVLLREQAADPRVDPRATSGDHAGSCPDGDVDVGSGNRAAQER